LFEWPAHQPVCCASRFGAILGHDVELWQRDCKVAVFYHKAKPPIVNDWPTVATGKVWESPKIISLLGESEQRFALLGIKTQTVLPSADTAAMLFWALLATGQINMRKVDGWQTLATKPIDQPIDLAA
jgi:hypothetical protein